jgi:hypothetical protein
VLVARRRQRFKRFEEEENGTDTVASLLQPAIFAPSTLPNVFGPVTLSPQLFAPAILAPFALGPTTLSPSIFNPGILYLFVHAIFPIFSRTLIEFVE